jgi:hypothetical protein
VIWNIVKLVQKGSCSCQGYHRIYVGVVTANSQLEAQLLAQSQFPGEKVTVEQKQ